MLTWHGLPLTMNFNNLLIYRRTTIMPLRWTPFILLWSALALGIPAQAGYRYSLLRVDGQGTWTLRVVDTVSAGSSNATRFPFYYADKPGNNGQNWAGGDKIDGKGQFQIGVLDGTAPAPSLDRVGADCEVVAGKDYQLTFDTGKVYGMKALDRVLYLYSPGAAALLIRVKSNASATSTSTDLTATMLDQANATPDGKRFEITAKDKYRYTFQTIPATTDAVGKLPGRYLIRISPKNSAR
jgi:hypothetical protein